LATGGMPVSVDRFVAIGVTHVSLRPLITVGKSRCVVVLRYCLGLGASSA
jgi:hypothetical protein